MGDALTVICGRGRSPCGERGLKCRHSAHSGCACSRSPCGERGLKLDDLTAACRGLLSLPVRGAWIEMTFYIKSADAAGMVAPRAGSVD